MQKNKKMRSRRRINDIGMIGLCLFALIGGLVVFRSYAEQKNNTKVPNVVSMTGFKIATTNGSATYQFATNKNLNYCISFIGQIKSSVPIVRYETITQKLKYDPVKRELCFRPMLDANKVTLTLDKTLQIKQLTITKPNEDVLD